MVIFDLVVVMQCDFVGDGNDCQCVGIVIVGIFGQFDVYLFVGYVFESVVEICVWCDFFIVDMDQVVVCFCIDIGV